MNRTLYVCHSGQNVDLSAIEDLFTMVGDVETTQLMSNPEPARAARVGMIAMSTVQQALDCVERFNGHLMNGQPLSVDLQIPKINVIHLSPKLLKKKRSR